MGSSPARGVLGALPLLLGSLRGDRSHPLKVLLTPNRCARLYRYKILFTLIGLIGQYFTRGLYTDAEVTYVPRNNCCPCCGEPGHQPTVEDGVPK